MAIEEVIRIELDVSKTLAESAKLETRLKTLKESQKQLKQEGQEGSIQYQRQAQNIKRLSTELSQNRKIVDDNTAATRAQTGSIEEQRRRLSVLTAQWKKQGTQTEAGRKKQAELGKQVRKLTDDLKKQERAVGDNRRNVGNYQDALGQLSGQMGGQFSGAVGTATRAVIGLNTAFRAIIASPIGLILTAIAAVLGTVGLALGRTQEGIDATTKRFDQLQAVVNVVLDRLTNVGSALISIFTGDFEQGIEDLTTAFDNMGDEIAEEVELVGQLADQLAALEEQENINIITSAKRGVQIAEFRLAAKDELKDLKERSTLLENAQKVTSELFAAEIKIAEGRLKNALDISDEVKFRERLNELLEDENTLTIDSIGISQSNRDDQREVAELIAKIIQLRKTELDQLRTIESEKQSLLKRSRQQQEKDFLARQKEEEAEAKRLEEEADALLDEVENVTVANGKKLDADAEYEEARTKKAKEEADKRKKIEDASLKNNLRSLTILTKSAEDLAGKGTDIARGAAVTETIINTIAAAQAAYKALAGIPVIGPALGGTAAALATAQGLQRVAEIRSAAMGDVWTFGAGGKAGMFGGKSHAAGGTKGYFEDGTRVEVEKDEAFVVVNKRDSELLQQLSDINSIHGKPFMRDGGMLTNYFQDGGIAQRGASASVDEAQRTSEALAGLIDDLPQPVVFVEDIRSGVGNQVAVEQRATA